jgi:hypothetical protein
LQAISHRTLSGFRSGNKAALDDLFVQVVGMLRAEGLISLERVTLDGTKIKANAGRAARQRASRREAAVREVERLQQEKKHDRKDFVSRASSTDPDAHVMRNGEGGTVPSYNVQLLTDATHGLVVNVDATTDAIDYRQMQPALERCERTLGQKPKQERCGLRQFRCRNRLKVAMEATWACLSYNLTRWFSLRSNLNLGTASA